MTHAEKLRPVDKVEIRVLVDNVTDNLSSVPENDLLNAVKGSFAVEELDQLEAKLREMGGRNATANKIGEIKGRLSGGGFCYDGLWNTILR